MSPSRSLPSVPARNISLSSELSSSSIKRLMASKDENLNDEESDLLFRLQLDSIQLHGRQSELHELRDAYARINRNDKSELVLVYGVSGCGKDSLIEAFRSKLPEGQCLYAEGKFDQLSNSDAFAVIVNACNQLCTLLAEEHVEEMRTTFVQTLGTDADVLSQRMPAFAKLLLGGDSTSTTIPYDQQQEQEPSHTGLARLKVMYRNFLHCLCSRHSVILFLNDLQWSDETSRQLIRALVTDVNSKHLLIIGAYRNENTTRQEVLERSLLFRSKRRKSSISHSSVSEGSSSEDFQCGVVNIGLKNLDQEAVQAIVEQVTNKKKDTLDFAKVVHRKTDGNPFFVKQYLDLLQSRGSLTRNMQTGEWDYDLPSILIETEAADNVVKLLTDKVKQLPESVQAVLRVASFLGHRFSADILERICAKEIPTLAPSSALYRERIVNALSVGLREGLLEKLEDKNYKFSHDSVQESLYSMIESSRGQEKLHLRIGRILIQSSDKPLEDWLIFLLVDNLNRGSAHIQRVTEQEELVRWNLEAARIAARKTSLHAAVDYLWKGIRIMDEHKWVRHYRLSLDVFSMAAEMELSTGNFSRCKIILDEIHDNATSVNDCLPVYLTEVALVGCSGSIGAAISLGISILEKLGEPLPRTPSRRHVVLEFRKAKRAIRNRSDAELLSLPRMENERKLTVMKLLSSLVTFAYLWGSGKNVFAITMLRMTTVSCKYGLSLQSPHAFVGFGLIHATLGFYDEGVRFGNLAAQMATALEAPHMQCKILYMQSCMLNAWRVPLIEAVDPLLQAYHHGIAYSDLHYAYLSIYAHLLCCYLTGIHLDRLIEGCRTYIAEMEECKLCNVLGLILPMLQEFEKLRGNEPDPQFLSGKVFDHEAMVEELVENKQVLALTKLRHREVWLLHLFDCDDNLPSILDHATRHRKTFPGHMCAIASRLYVGCGCYTMYKSTGKSHYRTMGRKCARELMAWSKKGFVMAKAMGLFVNALMVSTSRFCSRATAERAFQDAIESAQKTQQPLLEGESYSRLILVMLKDGDEDEASRYFAKSVKLYEESGHMAKVKYLRKKYPEIQHNAPHATLRSSASHLNYEQDERD